MKGKGKGKSRQFRSKGRPPQQANWSEAMWTSMRNKGKGYGGSKGMGKPPVNAYTMQYEMGGMELQTPELSLASSLAAPEGHERKAEGMLDCGATASAAPDVAVKGLIQAVLAQDHGARVDIEPYMKPFFRFGNGKCGQALFRVTLSSSISGQHRSFSLYSLPNPEVMDSKHIVPILVGMDHLGPHGCQMLIDFGYGYVIDGADPNPQMYRLNTNSKGHYVYDILYHLTRGKSNHHGHAHVHVCSQDDSKKQSMVLQFRPLEFYNSVVARVDHADCEHRQSLMWKLFENSRRVASSAQMCSLQSSVSPDDIPFREFLRHGAAPSSSCLDVRREGSSQIHQGPQGQESTEKALATTGQGSRDPLRSEGSGSVAVLQESRGRSVEQQCSRSLAALRSVQPEIGVYTQDSPSNTTQVLNPKMTERMLAELKPLLQGARPTKNICKAMMDKITADVQLETLIKTAVKESQQKSKAKEAQSSSAGYPKPKMEDPPPKQSSSPRTSPSQASWELLSPEASDLDTLLTAAEKTQLLNMLKERKAAQVTPMTLEAAYQLEMEDSQGQ